MIWSGDKPVEGTSEFQIYGKIVDSLWTRSLLEIQWSCQIGWKIRPLIPLLLHYIDYIFITVVFNLHINDRSVQITTIWIYGFSYYNISKGQMPYSLGGCVHAWHETCSGYLWENWERHA